MNFDDAVSWLRLSADSGDIEAMSCLGIIHLDRSQGLYDYDLAMRYLKESADKGDFSSDTFCTCAEMLGRCDLQQVIRLYDILFEFAPISTGIRFLKAADKYIDENDQDYNPELAFKFYSMSSEEGVAEASRKAGELLEYGIGTEQSYERAAVCYQCAADLGDAVAAKNLASLRARLA